MLFKKTKETPAEQLLRMIEATPGQAQPAGSPAPAHATRRPGELARELWAMIARRLMPGRRESDVLLWNLRIVTRVVWVVLAGVGAFVVHDLVFVKPKPRVGRVLLTSSAVTATQTTAQPLDGGKSLTDYLETAQQRNPFTGQVGDEAAPKPKTSKKRLDELTGGLVVVGIDRGPNPVALIEDTGQQRTYVVKIGDELNGMVVKRIDAEGVVVSYEGEELVLP